MQLLAVALITSLVFTTSLLKAQSKKDYLEDHRYDLLSDDFNFPEQDFTIVGFGAVHGSADTYKAELILLRSLISRGLLAYYIPETNYSQAHFFNKFLQNGDTALLKELSAWFQTIVVQEGTIETYQHWQNIKKLNDKVPVANKIEVVGLDIIEEYKFPILHILELTESSTGSWPVLEKLEEIASTDTTSYRVSSNSYSYKILKRFVEDYRVRRAKYQKFIQDTIVFNHLIKNIEYTFLESFERDEVIFNNYADLSKTYNFERKRQFAKYGFNHLLKSLERDTPSFFARLVDSIYAHHEVVTVMGYLTNSEVLWDKIYDEEGNYQTYTIEQGYGIGDYWKEYFRGIKYLKRAKLSDITLFRLNATNSPYDQGTDLVKVNSLFKRAHNRSLHDKSTTDFIDYAVLISNSKAQTPIEEMR